MTDKYYTDTVHFGQPKGNSVSTTSVKVNADRIAEIKAHREEGRPIRRIDAKYLLDQLEQAREELSKRSVCKGCPIPEGMTDEEVTFAIEQVKSGAGQWIPVTERLPYSGEPVLVYWYEPDYEVHQTHICEYYRKGDVVEDEVEPMGDTPDERLLDVVLGGRGNKIIEQNGFYIFDCVDGTGMCKWRRHSDCITHWMPLPEPPKGE